MVVRGRLLMDFRDRTVTVETGELLLVPRGTEHRPHTEAETWIMMIELLLPSTPAAWPKVSGHTGSRKPCSGYTTIGVLAR